MLFLESQLTAQVGSGIGETPATHLRAVFLFFVMVSCDWWCGGWKEEYDMVIRTYDQDCTNRLGSCDLTGSVVLLEFYWSDCWSVVEVGGRLEEVLGPSCCQKYSPVSQWTVR